MSIRYPASSATRTTRRRVRSALLVTLGLVLGASAFSLADSVSRASAQAAAADFYGEPVYLEHQPTAVPMDIRIGCRISAFGVAPWRPHGREKDLLWEIDTRRALRAMSVPDAVVDVAIQRIRAGAPDDVAGFGNASGEAATGQAYEPRYSTTYRVGDRRTVCHDSSTRFASEHRREYATVYRITHEGATYHLGEFLACGNVSRFFPAAAPAMRPAQLVELPAPESQQAAPGGYVIHKTPEPGALALVGLALAGVIASRKS